MCHRGTKVSRPVIAKVCVASFICRKSLTWFILRRPTLNTIHITRSHVMFPRSHVMFPLHHINAYVPTLPYIGSHVRSCHSCGMTSIFPRSQWLYVHVSNKFVPMYTIPPNFTPWDSRKFRNVQYGVQYNDLIYQHKTTVGY